MADFNVKVKDVENSAGFFGASRGAQTQSIQETVAKPSQVVSTAAESQGLATLIGGVGQLFTTAVGAADSLIKSDVDRRAQEAGDQIFDEFGLSDASVAGRSIEQEPRPEEIGKAEQNLKRLNNAYQRGAVSESAYWARLESVSRQLRARYPGHRDYIDARVSNIAGGKPANQLVRGLMEQASSQRAAAGQSEKDRLQYLESITKAGFYKPGMENLGYMELVQTTGPMYAQKQQIDMMKSQIDLARSNNQATGEIAARTATKTINLQMMDTLTNVTSPMGKSYQEITSKIREINSGANLSTDDQTMLRASFSQLRQDFMLKAQEGLAGFGADLTDKQRQEALAPALQFFETVEEGLINKDLGALTRGVNRLEAMKTNDEVKLYQSAPELAAIAAMNRTLGPNAAAIVLGASDKLNSAYLKVLVDDSIVGVFGKGKPIKQVFDDNNTRNGSSAPAVNRTTLDTTLSILTNPASSPEERSASALSLYGPGNGGFISTRNPKDRMEIYNRMVNQSTFDAVKVAAQKNPQAMEDYKGWAKDTFLNAFKVQANTINNMVQTDSEVIKFNTVTGMLEVAPLLDVGPGTNRLQGTGDIAALDRNQRIKDATPAVNDFNRLIAGVAPVLKEEGREVGQYVNTILGGVGLRIPPVTQGIDESKRMNLGMSGAVRVAGQAVGEIQRAEGSRLADISRSAEPLVGGFENTNNFGTQLVEIYDRDILPVKQAVEAISADTPKDVAAKLRADFEDITDDYMSAYFEYEARLKNPGTWRKSWRQDYKRWQALTISDKEEQLNKANQAVHGVAFPDIRRNT